MPSEASSMLMLYLAWRFRSELSARSLSPTSTSTPAILNFVFGIAQPTGEACVISLFRLYLDADEARFRGRALKEAMHELGHTFGLGHCANPSCVMWFSNTLEETDRKGAAYCPRCEETLGLARRPR
jgi:predicted Zn-dependent protease